MHFMLKSLVGISILIELIAAHGHFYEPPTRSLSRTVLQRTQQGCNVDWVTTYNNDFDCSSVCGNVKGLGIPDAYDTLIRQPIQRTYTSGQWIEVTATHINHAATFRVKLCKLSNSSSIPTQACFDENHLEVMPVTIDGSLPSPGVNNFQLDKYTVASNEYNETMKQIASTMPAQNPWVNQTIMAKLPEGFICDNCVLQLQTQNYPLSCRLADGTVLGMNWRKLTTGSIEHCPSQAYFGCSDIKIVAGTNFNTTLYKKTQVQTETGYNSPIVNCMFWHVMPAVKVSLRAKESDDIGLQCLTDDLTLCKNFPPTSSCFDCYDLTKICPDRCYCKWYKKNALKFPPRK